MKRGEVVTEFGPWAVVNTGTRKPGAFVVVDLTMAPVRRVYGPNTRKECESWCRVGMHLLAAIDGQVDER